MSTSWLCGFGGWVGLEGLKILQFQFLLTSRRAVRGKVWEVDGCWCVLEDGDRSHTVLYPFFPAYMVFLMGSPMKKVLFL